MMTTWIRTTPLWILFIPVWIGGVGDARAESPLSQPFQEAAAQVTHADARNRLKGIETLKTLKDPRGTPALIKALEDPNGEVRVAALRALKFVHTPNAVLPLLNWVKPGVDPFYILLAADALSEIGDPQAIPALVQALTDVKDWSPRFDLAHLVGRFGSAAAPALTALLDHPDPGVKCAALAGLGRSGDPFAIPAIVQHLQFKDNKVQAAAEQALQAMRWEDVWPVLGERLKNPDVVVQRQAFKILCSFRHRVAMILPPLLKHKDEYIRQRAEDLLRANEDARRHLEDLPKADSSSRLATLETLGLGNTPSDQLVEGVAKLLKLKPEADVRAACAKLLGEAGDPAALPMLSILTHDPDANVQAAADMALQSLAPNHNRVFKKAPPSK